MWLSFSLSELILVVTQIIITRNQSLAGCPLVISEPSPGWPCVSSHLFLLPWPCLWLSLTGIFSVGWGGLLPRTDGVFTTMSTWRGHCLHSCLFTPYASVLRIVSWRFDDNERDVQHSRERPEGLSFSNNTPAPCLILGLPSLGWGSSLSTECSKCFRVCAKCLPSLERKGSFFLTSVFGLLAADNFSLAWMIKSWKCSCLPGETVQEKMVWPYGLNR